MKYLCALLLPCLCIASDKSDRLPSVNHDNVTNNITITNTSPAPSPRPSRSPRSPRAIQGEPHPAVQMAHELSARQRLEEDAATCCCFFRIKKKI